MARFYRLPRAIHDSIVMPLAWKLPVSTDNFSLDFKLKRFLLGAPHPPAIRNQVWLGSFDAEDQKTLLVEPEAGFDAYEDVVAADAECHARLALE